jgi:branched-chain amino acid transport system ATP-binding protein
MRPLAFLAVAAVFAAALAFTAVANSYYVFVMATMALTAIVGIGLNVLLGLTGQVSFGHVGFYAIGAYVVAILTATAKLSFWIALPVAAALATLTGALLALPAMRVRGPYLAMVTIAFAFIVEQIAVEWSGLTGGQNGIMGIPQPAPFEVPFGERGVALMAIVVAAALLYAFCRAGRRDVRVALRLRDAVDVRVLAVDPVRAGGDHRRRRHGDRAACRRRGRGAAARGARRARRVPPAVLRRAAAPRAVDRPRGHRRRGGALARPAPRSRSRTSRSRSAACGR